MQTVVRFAPSPTGRLHVGNARVALVNWLFARKMVGRFLLRIDDTDRERSTLAYEQGIEVDLKWLGLAWDSKLRQSERLDRYDAAAEKLKAAGRLYPCYETAEELEGKRRRQLSMKKPPVYDRAALKLSAEDRARLEAEGRKPHWRFLLNATDVRWSDRVHGQTHYDCAHLSDPVLIRADGSYLYTLPSVVDDIDCGVTDIIRGEDHVTNSAPQIQLFEALGATPPAFAHLTLLVDAKGEGLSKRLGSLALDDLRGQGIEPMAVNSLLASLGTADAVRPHADLDELVNAFDFAKFGRASPRFDPVELEHLNARLLHHLSFDEVKDRLAALGVSDMDAAFWDVVRGNLKQFSDAALWARICRAELTPAIENPGLLHKAAELLPPEPWDASTWPAWTQAVKAATGLGGKALFMPLRLALTGLEHGPELKDLLPLIGRARALKRLAGGRA